MGHKFWIAALIGLLSTTLAQADPQASSLWPDWCHFARLSPSGCTDTYDRKPYPSILESILFGGQNCYDRKPMPPVSTFANCAGTNDYIRKPMPAISPTAICTPPTPGPLPSKR